MQRFLTRTNKKAFKEVIPQVQIVQLLELNVIILEHIIGVVYYLKIVLGNNMIQIDRNFDCH